MALGDIYLAPPREPFFLKNSLTFTVALLRASLRFWQPPQGLIPTAFVMAATRSPRASEAGQFLIVSLAFVIPQLGQ